MMKMMNKYLILLVIIATLLCFVGCQDAQEVQSDVSTSTNSSYVGGESSKVPIVIVDDAEDSSATQSKTDEIIDKWENVVPEIEIEVKPSQDTVTSSGSTSSATTSTESKTDDTSSKVTSSEKEESDNSSEEQSSSDVSSSDNSSSKEEEASAPQRPDDGYFDVAV